MPRGSGFPRCQLRSQHLCPFSLKLAHCWQVIPVPCLLGDSPREQAEASAPGPVDLRTHLCAL